MIWLRCYCSRKGDRLIIRRRFSLGKDQKQRRPKGQDRVFAPISYGGRGKMCAEGRTKQGEAAYTDGFHLPQTSEKRKILPAAGGVFQRNTAAGRFGSRGQVENRASAEGQRVIFLVGREPFCQNRGSLLRIKFQSLGFVKGRRVFR